MYRDTYKDILFTTRNLTEVYWCRDVIGDTLFRPTLVLSKNRRTVKLVTKNSWFTLGPYQCMIQTNR